MFYISFIQRSQIQIWLLYKKIVINDYEIAFKLHFLRRDSNSEILFVELPEKNQNGKHYAHRNNISST